MNRNILISISEATLLSFGLLAGVAGSNEVNAAVKVGQRNRLERNAYVYNSQGQRTKRNIWKYGKKVIVLGTKTIKGKKYARVGRNQYIRITNFNKDNISSKPTAILKHNAYIFDKNGKRIKATSLKKNKLVTILSTRYIKGKKYYQISKKRFIQAVNVTTTIVNEVNDNRNGLSQENVANNTNATNSIVNSSSTNSNVANNTVTGVANASNGSVTSSSINSSSAVSTNNSIDSSTNSEKTTDAKNTDSSSSDQEKGLKLLHTSYVFDKSGKHVLGSYVIKGNTVYVKGTTSINGKQYYGLVADDDDSIVGYVPVSAFDKDITGLKVTVSDKDFI